MSICLSCLGTGKWLTPRDGWVTCLECKGTGNKPEEIICYGVAFCKKDEGFGPASKGATWSTGVWKDSQTTDEPIRRGWRMFKRAHPNENQMAWEISALAELGEQ
jgi:hypothetical protein